jgi:transposase InsO family protein
LILLYRFDALSIDLKSTIPRSTLSNWKRKDISRIIGCDSLSGNDVSVLKEIAKCKKLLSAAKALYFLFHTIISLFKHADNKEELLRLNKTVILNTIEKVKPILGTKRILKSIGLSHSQMYYWIEKKKCHNSIFQLCQSRHPNQLLPTEVDIVKNYLLDERFKNWSSLSIYYQALRDKMVFMGIGTWYKYANRLGIKRKFFRINRKNVIGIRASRPLQLLHMDVTIFKPLDNTKVYIYFIVDNFSRAILNWKASIEYSSSIAMTVLKEAIQIHGIRLDTKLVTDGGPENHGEVSTFVSNRENLKQLIAQKDIIQSNSMVEAVNKHIKYYYLFKKDLQDLNDTIRYLSNSVDDYNDKPHGKLYGLTPYEVLNGKDPAKDNYQNDIAEARKKRLLQNQSIECCEI